MHGDFSCVSAMMQNVVLEVILLISRAEGLEGEEGGLQEEG